MNPCTHRHVTAGCEWCEAELRIVAGHNYTDDIIEVMRATIEEQRATIAHLEACNDQLRIAETELNRELRKRLEETEQLRQNALAYWVPKAMEGT